MKRLFIARTQRALVLAATTITCISFSAIGQTTYPYTLKLSAGAFPLGDGAPATNALLYEPNAIVADAARNVYILDAGNYRIRKVTPTGTISTLAELPTYGYDMKLASDGSLVVGGTGGIVRVSPAGQVSIIAGGNAFGYAGDGGPAANAQLGLVYGIALDAGGNIYFCDESGAQHHVRMIAASSGTVRTIGGSNTTAFTGDNVPAANTGLNSPRGVAVDSSGNVYVADSGHYRVRKFMPDGTITTVAGNGTGGQYTEGQATASRLGWMEGIWVDNANNLYIADWSFNVVLKVTSGGTLTRIAGSGKSFDAPGDGVASAVSIYGPEGVSADSAGNMYVSDDTHVVRRLGADGNLNVIAGRPHFSGDGGQALSAVFNHPNDVAIDNQGNLLVADSSNYRIRKIATDGTVTTIAGTGVGGTPSDGVAATRSVLPYVTSLGVDAAGNIYLAGGGRVYKINAAGIITIHAGSPLYGDTGDGGPATAAATGNSVSIAVDARGNVYLADYEFNRIRKINADTGIISAWAGNGNKGSAVNGVLATSAPLNLGSGKMVVDSKGNLYFPENDSNYTIRKVSADGMLSLVAGNGTFGRPDSGVATGSVMSTVYSLAVDGADNLYVGSSSWGDIYRIANGNIRRISGSPSATGTPTDGAAALSVSLYCNGMRVDAAGDIYCASSARNNIWKLAVNTPTGMAIVDGNSQSGETGKPLAKPLKVQVAGRSGVGVSGLTIDFAVTSGSATLSTRSSTTDATGAAAVSLTMGNAPGPVTVTATATGTSLQPVTFTLTATQATNTCAQAQPVIRSVTSAGDFGGADRFAPGSWMEIKGSNLAPTTRQWASADFNGTNAPTRLDNVTVTINGKPAYISYISPTQINAQAPADTAVGSVPLVVSTSDCASGSLSVTEAPVVMGLLAPSAFRANQKQYLVATLEDGYFVGPPNLISGAAFRPVAPGSTVTAYGIGFGAVSPATSPGVVVAGNTSVPNLSVTVGGTPARVTYGGLAPGNIGLYQFNFEVPNVSDGDQRVTFQVGSTPSSQELYLTVGK